MPSPIRIRPARVDDDAELARLQEIEVHAGTLFIEVDMPAIAEDDPPTSEDLRGAEALLVAVDDADHVLGYARIDLVDGHAHLEQLSVDPAHSRQGIGGALLDAVASHASGRGDGEVTLTTFRDVPFNRPYYERHGYSVLAPADLTSALLELVAIEAAHGLDPAQRVVMRLPLGTGRTPAASPSATTGGGGGASR